ncbi:hypothetical protein SCUCBS95973_004805 [Sporothrix curviconia]|uniref:Metalloprotease m41 ftsh n=1 Tax=Sporothrix curviconia TaxID=1260050 RepID=A0ABP0BRP0_9PEZI
MERDPQEVIRELLVKLEEERRGREEERRGREEERRGREEERRGREEERRGRLQAEEQRATIAELRAAIDEELAVVKRIADKTAFVPFLSLCYRYLFQPVTVQEKSSLRSSGGLTSVLYRNYPRELRPWTAFADLHDKSFSELLELFGDDELFPAPIAIHQIQRDLSPSPLANEADVRPFEVAAIELRAKDIITQYLAKRPQEVLRVVFRTNPYSLRKHSTEDAEDTTESNENEDDEDESVQTLMRDANLSRDASPVRGRGSSRGSSRGRRQSRGRSSSVHASPLASRQGRKRPASSPPPGLLDDNAQKRLSSPERRMVPDRWCLAQYAGNVRRPLLTVEHKAAHKVTPDLLMETLGGRQCDVALFADAAKRERQLSEKRQRSKLGTVVSVDDEDSESEAEREADEAAAAADSGQARQQESPASPARPASQTSRNRTAQVLTQAFHYMVESGLSYSYVSTGESLIFLHIDYDIDPSVLYYCLSVPKREIRLPSVGEVDDSRPGLYPIEQYSAALAKQTPVAQVLTMILLSLQKAPASFEDKERVKKLLKVFPEPYGESTGQTGQQAGPSQTPGGNSAPGAQLPTGQGNKGSTTVVTGRVRSPQHQYCTQKCLRGLRYGLPLDETCPNVELHRAAGIAANTHNLAYSDLGSLICTQLAANLDDGCTALDAHGKFGAIGALFKVTVYPHGYTLVAKGVQADDCAFLDWEERVYGRLASLQGTVVPVCLGVVDLRRAYMLTGGARICRLMLLSYVGEKAGRDQVDDEKVGKLFGTLLAQGVEHGDLRWDNVLWNEEQQRLMVIDFDRTLMYAASKRPRLEWNASEWDGPIAQTN